MSILKTYLTSLLRVSPPQLQATGRVMGQAIVDLTSMVMQSAGSHQLQTRGMNRDSLYLGMMSFVRVNASKRNVTPDHIAEAFNVSRRLMYNVFADNGTSPADVIRQERLRRASVLLGMPGATVRDVAQATGFADMATFGRAFSRHFQILPSQWIAQAHHEKHASCTNTATCSL
jgi:transcriptional regulator GlxA family with amidase domain